MLDTDQVFHELKTFQFSRGLQQSYLLQRRNKVGSIQSLFQFAVRSTVVVGTTWAFDSIGPVLELLKVLAHQISGRRGSFSSARLVATFERFYKVSAIEVTTKQLLGRIGGFVGLCFEKTDRLKFRRSKGFQRLAESNFNGLGHGKLSVRHVFQNL